MWSSSHRSSRSQPSLLGFSDAQQQPPSSRGDSATAGSRGTQQQLPDDKDSGPGSGGGSRTDELSKLEHRLAAMESRLSDFEAMLQRSFCGRSISGDCASNWPDSSATTGGDLLKSGMVGTGGNNASASAGTTEEAQLSSRQLISQGDASPLNLVFSTENEDKETSSSSTTWTDLDYNAAKFNGNQLKKLNESCAAKQQQQQQQKPVSPRRTVASSESFEITRYSTQDSVIYQERYELATHASLTGVDCTDRAAGEALLVTGGGGALRRQQQQQRRQLMMLQASNCQLLTTTLAERAEPLPAQPTGRRGGRVVLETGSLRELAEPAAGAEKCGGDGGGSSGVSSNASSSWQLQLVPPTLCHRRSSPSAHSAASSETATASCPAEPIAWSRVSRVGQDGASASVADRAATGPVVVEISRCAPPPVSICQDRRSIGEVNNNEQNGGSADQSWLLGGEQDDAVTASTVSSTATVSMPTETSEGQRRQKAREHFSADCHLCADFGTYARSRLNELKLSGLNVGLHRGGQTGSGRGVSVQRSGFGKQNTAFIASLASRAADKFDSDADLASYVRLELRRLGFECAVVIGRQFTGCICGQESSRLLIDIADRTCLIFSFFQLAGDLSKRVPLPNK